MDKAQISLEYLVIVGFVLIITIPLIVIFNTHSSEMNEEVVANQADNIASKIVDAAESVYYLGESSKITFRVYMPKNINSAAIGDNEVVFYVKKMSGIDHVVKYSSVPINGSISTQSGVYDIVVESKGDHVWVSN